MKKLDHYHLTHPLATLCVVLPFIYFGYGQLGAYLAIGFYLGREVRDSEIQLGMNFKEGLEKHGPLWALQGLNIFKWEKDNHLDFWPVMTMLIVISWFI